MRRLIAPLLLVFPVLSAPLAGQALSFGFAGTLGGDWSIEAGEFGVVLPVAVGPLRNVSGSVRAGWFGDNRTSIISHQRGFVSAFALGLRSGTIEIFDVGGEGQSTTRIGFDVTLEAAGYLTARSPFPEGDRWMSAGVLPAVRIGQDDAMHFAILLGPVWFLGHPTEAHPFLGLRIELPLAHTRGGP